MKARSITAVIWVALITAMVYANTYVMHIGISTFIIIALYELFDAMKKKDVGFPTYILTLFYGLFCIVSLMLFPVMQNISKDYLMYIIIVTWFTDTFALFTGMLFGKTKLAPHLSPNKTMEGSLGGIIFGSLSGIVFLGLLGLFRDQDFFSILSTETFTLYFLIGVALTIIVQIGDLIESIFKRTYSIKDSGVIVYGHGGLLDRIDSLLFSVPFGLLFFMFMN